MTRSLSGDLRGQVIAAIEEGGSTREAARRFRLGIATMSWVMDDLPAHRISGVREAIEKVGARLLFLPQYSPDFNPMAFSKLKALLRKAAARTVDELSSVVTDLPISLHPEECRHYLEAAGYDPD